jgi:hypothetical protein
VDPRAAVADHVRALEHAGGRPGRPVGGLRGAPASQPAWSTPGDGFPPPSPPDGHPQGPDGGGRTRRRGRTLAGLAALAVVCLLLGAAGTYYVMDRFAPATVRPALDPQAGAAAEPSDDPGPSDGAGSGSATPTAGDEDGTGPEREEPDELHLASEQPVNEDSDYRSTLATVNAEDYDEALTVEVPCGDVTTEFDLGRAYEEFETTVGLTDDSDSGAEVVFTVIGDGEQLETKTLGLGEDAELSVDVTGVLRLELVSAESPCEGETATAAWAEPVVTR